jgi:hypothetical protein
MAGSCHSLRPRWPEQAAALADHGLFLSFGKNLL